MQEKKLIHIDMDDTLFNFKKAHAIGLLNNPHNKYPQSEYGFFSNLEPLEGAIDAVKALIDSNVYEPSILTAPSYKNPLCYTEKRICIEKYFGLEFTKELTITSHKNRLYGNFLIDDCLNGRGQDEFKGELIHFGGKEFKDWESIRNYLNF